MVTLLKVHPLKVIHKPLFIDQAPFIMSDDVDKRKGC